MLISCVPFLRFAMASSRRSRSTAKSLKRVTTGSLEGTWDTKRRCISLDLPVGVNSIKMIVEGVDGVHTMDFSSFECSASFVRWQDYDYPWSSSDFLLAREMWHHGRQPPIAYSHAYPRCRDIVRFENPTRPPFLRGGQRPWRGHSYSPSELRYTPPRGIMCPRHSRYQPPPPIAGRPACYGCSHGSVEESLPLPFWSPFCIVLQVFYPNAPTVPGDTSSCLSGSRHTTPFIPKRVHASGPSLALTFSLLQFQRLSD